jgi:hypothetical protein
VALVVAVAANESISMKALDRKLGFAPRIDLSMEHDLKSQGRRRTCIRGLVGIGVLFAFALLILALRYNNEPSYEGKKLSQWLAEMTIKLPLPGGVINALEGTLPSPGGVFNVRFRGSIDGLPVEFGQDRDRVDRVFEKMEPEAVSYLRRMAKMSTIHRFYQRAWESLPKVLQGRLPDPIVRRQLRTRAVYALGIIGKVATSAVADLRLIAISEKGFVASLASNAVFQINLK